MELANGFRTLASAGSAILIRVGGEGVPLIQFASIPQLPVGAECFTR